MTTKERLHKLVEDMSEDEAAPKCVGSEWDVGAGLGFVPQ